MGTENSEEEVDLEAVADEIGEELFGPSNEHEEDEEGLHVDPEAPEEGKELGGKRAAETPSPQPSDNSPAVQEIGAPKTWTKDAIQDWATIPERAKQEILKREEDFFRGIEGYKELAQRGQAFEQVIEPYRAVLTATQTDPVQLMTSFAANHYMLAFGSPQEKVQLAANLMSSYGIDLVEVAQFAQQAASGRPAVDPEVAHLRQRLAQLEQGQAQVQQQTYEQSLQNAYGEINAFRADPAHPFFDEVAEDMEQLLKTGAAQSLPQAYEIAVYRNPSTREKELARLTPQPTPTNPAPQVDKKKKALGANVNSSQQPRNGTVPTGTMEETLEETYAAIVARED